MQVLPIHEVLEEVKTALSSSATLILQAPPGAGKSTVLPLALLDLDFLKGQKIIMLEPRRLAARAVAQRMADLMGEKAGETIGYRVRFENRVSAKTKIEVVTEGILTRMLQSDNALEGVGMVIFDEFHERSLQADLALALCRESQHILREDLRLLIMSATLDGETLSALLGNAPVITSQGRQYPIEIKYLSQDPDAPVPASVAKVVRKALQETSGDILAFLPGAGEIRKTQEILEESTSGIRIHPLYGDLPQQEQQEAIIPNPYGLRKVVLATSIAETSLTIQGITTVVDSGLSRVPRFDPRSGLTKLETIRVSQDTASQRAGRAGRLGPGLCYRLWSESIQSSLQPHRKPEILEADLAPLVLELSAWGVTNYNSLAWLTPPLAGTLNQAKELLQNLDALDGQRITKRGQAMLSLPTHPRLAHLLLEGKNARLTALATDVAAILEERDPLRERGADLILRVETLRRWRSGQPVTADRGVLQRMEKLAAHWRKFFHISPENQMPHEQEVGKLVAAAYPERIAVQTGETGRYRLSNGRTARLPQHDPLEKEHWLAVAQMDAGGREGRIFLAAPLDLKDIMHLAEEKKVLDWDYQKGELLARVEKRIGNILIGSSPLAKIPDEARMQVLVEVLRKEGLRLLDWNEEVQDWQARLMSLRQWRPEEDWPDVSELVLLQSLEEWIGPYLINIRRKEDFGKLNPLPYLQALLGWPKSQPLDDLAPQKLVVPSGSHIRLQYAPNGSPPVLAVRLQELFGLIDTPTVNEGRTKVMLHLLSPGYKPQQVTQDLKSFWQNTYPEVRKELRMRYPRHHWPEDPWTAEAVRGAKRRT